MAGASALSLATLAGVLVSTVPVSDADMRSATDGLLVEVSAVRHLALEGPLERRVETRAEARSRRAAERAAAAADPETAARARLWERIGLAPRPAAAPVVVGALEAGAVADGGTVASYDPLGRRLSVPDWIPLDDQRTALAHALAHALTDARFGLREVLKIDLEGRHHLDGDAERARLALVEGDAALTALELDDPSGALTGGHALPALAAAIASTPARPAAPDWARETASFAHADGLAFVARVRGRQRWGAVDALWAAPPRSTEQVLHPEAYDTRDEPVPVAAPQARAFGARWREEASDVLGELGLRTWLAFAVPPAIAERAAAGWGGDRATLFVDGEAPAPRDGETRGDGGAPADGGARASSTDAASFVAWTTVWDDVTDAEDFARTAPRALARLAGVDDAPPLDEHGRTVTRSPDGTTAFALARRGNAVALLLGAPEAALPVLDTLLTAAPHSPRRRPQRTSPQ